MKEVKEEDNVKGMVCESFTIYSIYIYRQQLVLFIIPLTPSPCTQFIIHGSLLYE